jgi:hypothetical protein
LTKSVAKIAEQVLHIEALDVVLVWKVTVDECVCGD